MFRVSCALLAAIPFLVAASPPAKDWKQQALAAAASYIDKANDEWARAIIIGDADVMSAPYDTNGIFVGPDGSVSIGKAAVRSMYRNRPATVKVLKASIKSDGRAAHDPDDVYEWGTATMTVKRGDKVKEASGRYLTVWHREGKAWLITRNIAF